MADNPYSSPEIVGDTSPQPKVVDYWWFSLLHCGAIGGSIQLLLLGFGEIYLVVKPSDGQTFLLLNGSLLIVGGILGLYAGYENDSGIRAFLLCFLSLLANIVVAAVVGSLALGFASRGSAFLGSPSLIGLSALCNVARATFAIWWNSQLSRTTVN